MGTTKLLNRAVVKNHTEWQVGDLPYKLHPVEAQDHESGAPVDLELAHFQRWRLARAHVSDHLVNGCEVSRAQRLLVLQRQLRPRKLHSGTTILKSSLLSACDT